LDDHTPLDLTATVELEHNSVSLEEVALIEAHLSDLVKQMLMQTDQEEE
jgi:hypothetical protein